MTNYQGYQISNLPWFGQIPAQWKVKRFKYLTQSRKELSKTGEEELLSVTEVRGIVKRRELRSNDESLSRAENLTGYKHVKEGDLVSNIMLVWKRGLGVSPYDGIVSPAYSVFTFNDECFPGYFHYLVRSNEYITEFRKHSTGITMSRLRLYDDSFGNVLTHFPPVEEQKLISRYLDKKTEQIDRLVEKIQKKIELLKQQRTSLINQCVTKGLDPNVEMKDSGIEWIGKIPKHWDCKKLKYISKITYGISPQETTYNDDEIGTVLINGPVEYSTTDFGYTRSVKWTTDPKNMVPKGSLLFCVRGSTTGRMNICHQDVSIGRGVCSIESKLDQDFTVFAMMLIRIYIQDQISGSTFPSVVKEDVDNFVLPCPPIDEQRSISKHIKDEVEVIDELIDLHAKKNVTLKEFRQSLISSAVTGKVRVTEDMI